MSQHLTISIKDESFAGKKIQEIQVDFTSTVVTIQEIIEARVKQEVKIYNLKTPEYFTGFIQPTDAEKTINGYKMKTRKPIDAEKQIYIALDAFQKNGFFVLVDNLQSTSLQQEVNLNPDTEISFIKLTALVGG